MTEKHTGEPGEVTVYRDDERYCAALRYGISHPPHTHHYIYTRPEHLGGVTTGSSECDGLTEDAEPWPVAPFGRLLDEAVLLLSDPITDLDEWRRRRDEFIAEVAAMPMVPRG